jgi:quercetin dioxygenase-like cupin family protein
MRTVTPDEATFIPAQPHRPGGVSFRHLLAGPDDAPDNYSLSLVDVAERYEAPRHRHNFEQVRVMLAGRFGFGPGAAQEAGSIGYFCEGTYYTQLGEGPSTTLLLQCGGASGSGYLGFDRLQRGIRRLATRGSFHDGVYTWHDAQGVKHNQDGYEAAWQAEMGRPVVYPKPRYQAPVIVQPEHFAWRALDARVPGVEVKRLGAFNERGLGVALWRFDAGARVQLARAGRRELLYLLRGSAQVHGRHLPAGSAVEALPGDAPLLHAGDDGAEWVGFSLPSFDD